MSEQQIVNPLAAQRRIATAHAARTPVDNQGRPITTTVRDIFDGLGNVIGSEQGPDRKPSVFTYDERGLLISADPE